MDAPVGRARVCRCAATAGCSTGARGGGWIGAWGSHAVDALRWCFGEITSVDARARIDVTERPDDQGRMHPCTAEDGLTATLGIDARHHRQHRQHVRRDRAGAAPARRAAARAACARSSPTSACCSATPTGHAKTSRRRRGSSARGTDRHDDPMRRFAEVVRDVVTSGEVPPGVPTFADGLACDLVLDQLRAAPVVTRAH